MAYFPHAYCKTLLGSASTPVVGTGSELTTSLLAGEIGIVDSKTHLLADVATPPSDAPMFYLAQGSFYQSDKLGPHHGGYQETVKSKGINPKYVSKLYKVTSANAINEVVTVEFADDCVDIACESNYYLRVDAKGSPALRHLTHNAYVNAPAYSGCCVGTDNIDPAVIALEWADYINDHAPINPFVQATAWRDYNYSDALNRTVTAAGAAALTKSGALTHAAGDRVEFDLAAPAVSSGSSLLEGYTLTVDTIVGTNDIFSVGMVVTGANVVAGTKLVRLVSGDGGAGSVFEVDTFNPVATATTITGATNVTAYASNSGTGTISLFAAADMYSASTTPITSLMDVTASALKIWSPLDSDTYVPALAAAADVNRVKLELVSAYVDTNFADCSFDPKDHFERQPVEIFASVVDESGDPCATTCITVSETQTAQQGKGFGETILREMIQFKRYRQEDFKTDPRLREVLGETVLDDIGRSTKYSCLFILHSVPRKANPSGMMDNDQYLVKVAMPDASFADGSVAQLEAWIEAACANAGNDLTFEYLQ
jgi:hypothetical protein